MLPTSFKKFPIFDIITSMKNWFSKLTIFWGSFLIFGIQPMVGRTLLPVFGGTAAVWVVCLCAFQIFLLAGYWYADWLSQKNAASKVKYHIGLLLLAMAWVLAVAFNRNELLDTISGGFGGNPAFEVLICVLCLVGVPYILLGSNSSLVQVFAGGDYKLYSISNAGSLLGLLAYPFVFEPYVSLTAQWTGFAIGIGLYALSLFILAFKTKGTSLIQDGNRESAATISRSQCPLFWILLPAASCFLLNSLTTHVTLDVMPMPLIWTASLGLFLLSYIFGFSGKADKLIKPAALLSIAAFLTLCWMNGKPLAKVGLPLALGAYGAFLLFSCTFLHSWLYVSRPDGTKLTRYYLFQSIGGAIGGVVASLVFPVVAKTIVEYPVALFGMGAMLVIGAYICSKTMRFAMPVILLVAVGCGAWLYIKGAGKETRPVVYQGRGFFGTISVLEAKAKTKNAEGCIREFVHGTTVHGIQANLPGKNRMPTTYYTPDASGYAIAGHPKYRNGQSMRVNITGLGVGVLFCYGRQGDYYRAYEISKDAMDVAMNTNLFTFVSDCPAKKDIVLGDARKGLEAELAAGVEPYDVIVVDAFTGDNLPYHLSTKEAFDLYFKLLKPDGILCVNISNWHLTLEPFMKTIGERYNVPLLGLRTADNYGVLQFGASIAFFCRKPDNLGPLPINNPNKIWSNAKIIDFNRYKSLDELPTDEKGSFINLIKW